MNPLTEQIVWEYRPDVPEDFYSVQPGSAQRLPNGNTLIADSDKGRALEVAPEGRIVWEFYNPVINEEGHRASTVRMKRYETEFIRRILAERSANGGAG